ncbi:hypothetical protein ZIOFF_073415 [Zingiber officinale]|uniref:Uncharacterized protein n=1 Tax=Zingiber officinale TaxID=94328 RepID=A0A8J5C988_ZINOF|nr:hypothetical protein ZIOFF_073415 [Zingiber officinale]
MRRGGELSLSDGWENGAGKAEGPVTIWVVLVCIWTCDPNPSFAFGATDPNDDDFSDTVRHLFGASVVITGHNFQQTHNNEMAEAVTKDFGRIDIFVHSLANGPEVTKPLLETSRRGYEGGMSSAKVALESDTKVLAFELHLLATKHQVELTDHSSKPNLPLKANSPLKAKLTNHPSKADPPLKAKLTGHPSKADTTSTVDPPVFLAKQSKVG